jgi:hypothetical protein
MIGYMTKMCLIFNFLIYKNRFMTSSCCISPLRPPLIEFLNQSSLNLATYITAPEPTSTAYCVLMCIPQRIDKNVTVATNSKHYSRSITVRLIFCEIHIYIKGKQAINSSQKFQFYLRLICPYYNTCFYCKN